MAKYDHSKGRQGNVLTDSDSDEEIHPLVRAEGNDGNKVRAFFAGEPFTAGRIYTVVIAAGKVKNHNGYAMDTNGNTKASQQ